LLAEDGALALDRHDLWEEPVLTPRSEVLQAGRDGPRLKEEERFATVPRMPASRGPRRSRRAKRRRDVRRARLNALLALLAIAVVVTLSLTAFSGGAPTDRVSLVIPAARLLPAGPPSPQVVATQGTLRLQLPVARSQVTAIGYHGAGEASLALEPVGRRGNAGFFTRLVHKLFGGGGGGLKYYALDGGTGPATGELDVGAAPGTDVYSPVDGTIVGLTPFVIDGRPYGQRIEIQPSDAPSVVVALTNLKPDPSLTVGSTVAATTSRLGTIIDLSGIERQALARYTQDAGNHVAVSVRPSATLAAS
jgi:hypothetical protein